MQWRNPERLMLYAHRRRRLVSGRTGPGYLKNLGIHGSLCTRSLGSLGKRRVYCLLQLRLVVMVCHGWRRRRDRPRRTSRRAHGRPERRRSLCYMHGCQGQCLAAGKGSFVQATRSPSVTTAPSLITTSPAQQTICRRCR